MSAPAYDSKEADFLSYGFLAVKASENIRRHLAGEQLNPDQRNVLTRARGFLKDVSSGSRLVSTGVSEGGNPSQFVSALSYSMDPIEALQDFIREQDVHEVMDRLAESVAAIAQGNQADENQLRAAEQFFALLQRSLIATIDTARRATSRGMWTPEKSAAHA